MRFLLASALALTYIVSAEPVSAQDTENPVPALTCKDLVLPITGIPDDVIFSFTVPTDDLVKQCTSANGQRLYLIDPLSGILVTPQPQSSQTHAFTVRDDEGHQLSASLVVTRD